ncbi:transporter [Ganoderma sinense ZZ0214-1]|uniref:Transporter n=1 Tax=Ganoderma sinense ZZ0214-1 TaxID=1077348 RepID=A0A2G8S4K3_9APHY|nr:transporter [Ganoderma sinense ZZ0214-1]
MLPSLRLTSALLLSLALSVSAGVTTHNTSPVTLALTKQFNLTGASKMLEIDQARAKALKTRSKASTSQARHAVPASFPLTNPVMYYSTPVGIGSPPKTYQLIVDTGSSNTWVGAQRSKSALPRSSKPTGDTVELEYGSSRFVGTEYKDTFHVGDMPIANQGFGEALFTKGFNNLGADGILGMGPTGLTCDTLFPSTSKCVPTVTDSAFAQNVIDAREVGMSFVPAMTPGDTNGELTLGGTDPSKIDGALTYVPITTTSPASRYVGFEQAVAYGDADNVILTKTAGITDTGTSMVLLATDAFEQYKTQTGAVMDNKTGLLRVTPEQFGRMRSLVFTIGQTPFDFTPNAQAWPRQLNKAIGGSPDFVYLMVGDLGSKSGGGLDFINGMAFLERFYQVYDSTNNRVGFAPTYYTYSLIN